MYRGPRHRGPFASRTHRLTSPSQSTEAMALNSLPEKIDVAVKVRCRPPPVDM